MTFVDVSGISENTSTRPSLETAILDKKAQFECSVKSPNAAEVEIWWQFRQQNVSSQYSDSHQVNILYNEKECVII